MVDHRGDNRLAAVGAGSLLHSDLRSGPVVFALKWTNLQISLQLAEMFPTRFVPARIFAVGLRCDPELPCDEGEHVWRQDFDSAQHAAGKPQVSKMHGKPKPVCIAPTAPNEREVLRGAGFTHQIALIAGSARV